MTSIKIKTETSTLVLLTHRMINRLKPSFNIYWLKVRISYHVFNKLAELINGDLAAKIERGILSKYLMDIECNCSLPYKVNGNCVHEGPNV